MVDILAGLVQEDKCYIIQKSMKKTTQTSDIYWKIWYVCLYTYSNKKRIEKYLNLFDSLFGKMIFMKLVFTETNIFYIIEYLSLYIYKY